MDVYGIYLKERNLKIERGEVTWMKGLGEAIWRGAGGGRRSQMENGEGRARPENAGMNAVGWEAELAMVGVATKEWS